MEVYERKTSQNTKEDARPRAMLVLENIPLKKTANKIGTNKNSLWCFLYFTKAFNVISGCSVFRQQKKCNKRHHDKNLKNIAVFHEIHCV